MKIQKLSTKTKNNTFILNSNKTWTYFQFDYSNGGDKWKGIWQNDYKYVDEIKPYIIINEEKKYLQEYFLNAEYDGILAKSVFKINNTLITLNTWQVLNKNIIITNIEIETKEYEEILIGFEVLINHKHYTTDEHEENYEIWQDNFNKHLQIKSNKNTTLIGFNKDKGDINFKQNPSIINYKALDGKTQTCLKIENYEQKINLNHENKTSLYITNGESNNQFLHTDFINLNTLEQKHHTNKEDELTNWLKNYNTENGNEFNLLTQFFTNSIRLLTRKEQVLAGYPWFAEFWTRDFFHSVKGLLCLNQTEIVRNTLKNVIQKYYEKNQTPRLILSDKNEYGSFDANLLIIPSIKNYVDYTNDYYFLNEIKKFLLNFEEQLVNIYSNKKLNDNSESWMDTLKRNQAIENLYFYYQTLNDLEILFKKIDIPKDFSEQKKETQTIIDSYYNKKGFFNDSKDLEELRPNQLFLINSGLIEEKKVQSVLKNLLNKKMFTPVGVRTLAKGETEYKDDSYHNGTCWGLTNNLLLKQLFDNNLTQEISIIFKNIINDMNTRVIGGLSETYNPKTEQPTNAVLQLWTHTVLFEAFDENMFGIKPKLSENKIILKLKPLTNTQPIKRFDKKIGDTYMDLVISKQNKQTIYEIYFSKQPEFSIELHADKNYLVNGESIEGKVFKPKTTNKIILQNG